MKEYSDIRVRHADGVAHVVINRPDRLNAIRIQTYRELIAALQAADDAPEVHVILLAGEGGQFTAGNDLADLAGADRQLVMDGVQGIFDCVAGLRKVLVAAVEGVAVGIGTTLLLHCDIAVASRAARFRLPFVNLGVSPEGGSSVLLPQAIGQKRARELLLTGRFFSAEEAWQWGLITAIAEPGEASEKAGEFIAELLRQPLDALLATKAMLRHSFADVSSLVRDELQVFAAQLGKEETERRLAALLRR